MEERCHILPAESQTLTEQDARAETVLMAQEKSNTVIELNICSTLCFGYLYSTWF